MVANDFGQLPVLDKEDRLRAIIHDLDIIECLLREEE